MTVLLFGATGATGEEVLTALLARGAVVRAMVRGPECAALLPGGVIPRIGDLDDPATVAEAAAGVSAVVFVGTDGRGERAALEVVAATCAASRTMLVVVENDDHASWIASVVDLPAG